ncbi:MAG TPA: response regulator [Candidatus Sumerlaeota bacterium]|nr:MAG: Response regulator rcp1 [candidate division BRC1 bacterium ADurb.BinA292]HOE95459.1 response regulator [Candidatus Sumerlaeota bacterium]HOR28793.1 response regulator [Candidatus Sumerlaeota bacterium]HPK01090.1 response regulator [Candidatus Sumerlaeota bacterium]
MVTTPEANMHILLVEDNPGDIRLVREALAMARLQCQLHVATDGDEAIDFLRRRGRHAQAPRPHLVLLDLNLPGRHGREVLREAKLNPELRSIPVIVLTTSQSEDDVVYAYDLYANCYIAKPSNLDEFMGIVKMIDNFWFSMVILPHGEGT